jgi:hypothetical protein
MTMTENEPPTADQASGSPNTSWPSSTATGRPALWRWGGPGLAGRCGRGVRRGGDVSSEFVGRCRR